MDSKIAIVYLGCKDLAELKANLRLPHAIESARAAQYEELFEHGMEFMDPAGPAFWRAWVVGRAARAGDPRTMLASEADRRARAW
jgi:hypothetical protein